MGTFEQSVDALRKRGYEEHVIEDVLDALGITDDPIMDHHFLMLEEHDNGN